jgi:hypothetical protein
MVFITGVLRSPPPPPPQGNMVLPMIYLNMHFNKPHCSKLLLDLHNFLEFLGMK